MDEINERLIAIEEWRATELAKQILVMEEWRAKQIRLTRKVVRWLALALVLFAAGGVWSTWRIFDLTEASHDAIVAQNAVDNQVAQALYRADTTRWQACLDRNNLLKEQLRQDQVQLSALIKAHDADGNKATAAAWRSYLKRGQETKLPECGAEPKPPEQEENVP